VFLFASGLTVGIFLKEAGADIFRFPNDEVLLGTCLLPLSLFGSVIAEWPELSELIELKFKESGLVNVLDTLKEFDR